MRKIVPISAFKDNYIWAIHSPEVAKIIVVDPGDPNVVLDYLQKNNLALSAILLTHHHWDHSAGIEILHQRFNTIPIYGSALEKTSGVTHYVSEQEKISIPFFEERFSVIEIPGHTKGHIAYFSPGMLFCGDTLFSCGCGRLFEGTPEQMFSSLDKIKKLPENTLIYCGHEYTLANIAFAKMVEPQNSMLQKRLDEVNALRANNLPSLPVSLKTELLTNPFLRCHEQNVISAVQNHGGSISSLVDIFAFLREWKNQLS